MNCPDYKPPDRGIVCIYWLPSGFCKHPRHFDCRELFGLSVEPSAPAPPCPLSRETAKKVITRPMWSGCGQGWSGWTLTTLSLILLRNIWVVRVVRAKSHISHMCESIYSYFYYILFSFLSLNFDFVKKHPDHLDHKRNHLGFTLTSRLDHP